MQTNTMKYHKQYFLGNTIMLKCLGMVLVGEIYIISYIRYIFYCIKLSDSYL